MARLLEFDPDRLATEFNSRAFSFTHSLRDSPLFGLSRLVTLAQFLEGRGGRRDVYKAAAGTAFGQQFAKNGARGLDVRQVVEEIESGQSWLVLKRIEQHPDYRDLVQTCLEELAEAVPDFRPGRCKQVEGFIFVTSPGGITPYHIDPQWSFLAQVRGHKTYRIYDVLDPQVISNPELENYYCGDVMAACYRPENDDRATVFELSPGQAVSQPLHAPHSAVVGGDYSISFTVAIVSRSWAWQQGAHLANHWLRTRGLNPGPVRDRSTDHLKSLVYRASVVAGTKTRGCWGAVLRH